MGGCVAAAAAHLVEEASYPLQEADNRALVAGEEHSHALALVALASRGPHHLALLAVLEPVAILEGLTLTREVDHEVDHEVDREVDHGLTPTREVAARQRRRRLAAYLCAHTRHS